MNLAIQYWKLNVIINDVFKFSVIMSKIFSVKLSCVIVFGSILNRAKKKKYSSEKLNQIVLNLGIIKCSTISRPFIA
jgi:hypothetical protein